MADDEMVEITPKTVRLRKTELNMDKRIKSTRGKQGGKK
jgi:predicted membrane GTPase involved in stress response